MKTHHAIPIVSITLLTSAFLVLGISHVRAQFVVHEWGTFTTLAASDGTLLPGLYKEEESLPYFVHSHSGFSPHDVGKGISAQTCSAVTLKMETPVLYFYSDTAMHVDVKVQFPAGTISQWFPDRTDGEEGHLMIWDTLHFEQPYNGWISWSDSIWARTTPEAESTAITKYGESHVWQSPRATDANLISNARGEVEKYLFYRGVGNATNVDGFANGRMMLETFFQDGALVLKNHSSYDIAYAFVWQRGADSTNKVWWSGPIKAGLRLSTTEPGVQNSPTWQNALTKFRDQLIVAGLYPKEADAMIDTWSQSYFGTTGLRVFWIVPREATDRTLPITISPQPTELQRVLVARSEVLTPAFERELQILYGKNNGDLPINDRYRTAYLTLVKKMPYLGVIASADAEPGTVEVGRYRDFVVTLRNSGHMDWTPGAPVFGSGQYEADYSTITDITPSVIPGQSTGSFIMRFKPQTVGVEEATLYLGGVPGFSYPLRGTGTAPQQLVGRSDPSSNTIVAYPNPATNTLTIVLPGQSGSITLCDILGRELRHRMAIDGKAEFDLSGLPPAMYIVAVESNGKRELLRIVKQ